MLPDTLTDMVNQMTEKVGLVHGLPYVADRQGFAATLEQVSTVVVSNILVSRFLVAPGLDHSESCDDVLDRPNCQLIDWLA